uniref:ubiquitinyl hydrolase 1 n=1 Tax=Amphiprion percula TaxID=161767 RepID=A0A3P8TC16_AMPPE
SRTHSLKIFPSSCLFYSDYHSLAYGDKVPGVLGLKNHGNTCFMNAVVQCLSNTDLLAEYLGLERYKMDLKVTESTKLSSFYHVCFSPLQTIVSKYGSQFRGNSQHDALEFLLWLLDRVHEDVILASHNNNNKTKAPGKVRIYPHYGNYVFFCQFLLYFMAAVVIKTWKAGRERRLTCSKDDAWKCPHCKQLQQGMVKMSLWTLPDILILHLKRFRQVGERRNKLTTFVHFPLAGLDLTRPDLAPPDFLYDLYAVCNHHGGMHGGHYTAFCRNSVDGQWYSYDDSSAEPVPEAEVCTRGAYILFYQRRNTIPPWSASSSVTG